jgi:hypothetical protein
VPFKKQEHLFFLKQSLNLKMAFSASVFHETFTTQTPGCLQEVHHRRTNIATFCSVGEADDK